MRRVRAQLAFLGPAIAGLFALTIALPPPALLYHEHAGGTRAHVHADDASTVAELLEHHHHHGHGHDHDHDADHAHPHRARDHEHQAAIAQPSATTADGALVHNDGSATGHWHERLRFHRAVAASLPVLSAGLVAEATPQAPPTRPGHAWAPPGQARAPPISLSLS